MAAVPPVPEQPEERGVNIIKLEEREELNVMPAIKRTRAQERDEEMKSDTSDEPKKGKKKVKEYEAESSKKKKSRRPRRVIGIDDFPLEPIVDAYIKGKRVSNVYVDGGAQMCVITERTMHRLGLSITEPSDCHAKLAKNSKVKCLGIIKDVHITVLDVSAKVDFYVMPSKGEGYPLILGRPWLMEVNADQKWGSGTDEYSSDESSYGDEESYTSEESSMEVMGLVFQQPQAKGSSTEVEVTAQEESMLKERFRNMLAKDLTKEEEEDHINMFKRYPHLFITDYSMIKGVDVIQHHIDLKPDAKPVAQKLRRLGVVQQEALVFEVRHMSRFIHLLSQIISPLQQLANQEVFSWEQEHLECFNEVKEVLGSLPTIMPLDPQGIYFLCPSVGLDAFGAVLMQKDPKTAYMRPIYFTSKVMTQGQNGYTDIERLVFSLIVAIRKFRSYLLPKPFIILTLEHNLPYAIQHMSISSKISKWVLELQDYEYTFIVEDSTRASLADVLTYSVKEKKITPKAQDKLDFSPQGELEDAYTLLFDGPYHRQRNKAAGGFVILNEEKKKVLKKGIQLHLAHSNNEAEYATLKAGLEECKSMGIKKLMVKGDALLIVKQVQGTWACKNSKLLYWMHEVKLLMKDFEAIQIQHISRQHNKEADNIANTQFEMMVRGIKFKEPLFSRDHGGYLVLFRNRWAEAASVARITAADVSKFVLDYICSRFGTPLEILSDRGPEKTNGVLCKIITKHVRDRPQDWDKHLTAALWAYRTSFKVSTQFTPYHLVYGQEALLPIEVELGSLRVLARETTSSKEKLEQRILDLQRLELDREAATDYYITQANKKREQFNNKIKEKKLEEGMLVMRYYSMLDLSHSKKFLQRWEGPYVIFKKIKNGSYRLQDLSDKIHKYPVNGWRLKEFFQRIQLIKEERQVSLDA
ncbi:hypothetical protein L7F22_044697 [Adiantum nelumboides]|nr:hypothetical protein [Adiantum nelumboides]